VNGGRPGAHDERSAQQLVPTAVIWHPIQLGDRERAASGETLIVDLNRVTFIDSAGPGALVGTARRAAKHGGSLHAVCARPQTRKLLWMTGVDRRNPLTATVDGALMLMAPSEGSSGSGT
jgi:anti-anti-sigma factor